MHWVQNPWGVKKAYQMLLGRLVGTHLVHAKVALRSWTYRGYKADLSCATNRIPHM